MYLLTVQTQTSVIRLKSQLPFTLISYVDPSGQETVFSTPLQVQEQSSLPPTSINAGRRQSSEILLPAESPRRDSES